MDTKEIAQKVEDGGNEADLINGLDDVKKADVYKHLTLIRKEKADKELEELKGRRAAKSILEKELKDTEGQAISLVKSQIRAEQITKARTRFQAELKLTDEEMKSVDEAFTTEDTGVHFDSDLLVPIYRKAYAKAHADTLIQAKQDKAILEKNALDFNGGAANAGHTGSGGGDSGKQYAPEVYDMVRAASKQGIPLTLDQAERGMRSGPRVFTPKK